MNNGQNLRIIVFDFEMLYDSIKIDDEIGLEKGNIIYSEKKRR